MSENSTWGSKIGFILASAGSAIGLGAVWKFPYMTAANGGGSFLLVFLIFTLLIGLPLLLAEFVLGRILVFLSPMLCISTLLPTTLPYLLV